MERATESHDTIEPTRHDTVQKMMLCWVSVTLVEALALHPLLSFVRVEARPVFGQIF